MLPLLLLLPIRFIFIFSINQEFGFVAGDTADHKGLQKRFLLGYSFSLKKKLLSGFATKVCCIERQWGTYSTFHSSIDSKLLFLHNWHNLHWMCLISNSISYLKDQGSINSVSWLHSWALLIKNLLRAYGKVDLSVIVEFQLGRLCLMAPGYISLSDLSVASVHPAFNSPPLAHYNYFFPMSTYHLL